tara:strand:- start:47 stop:238 length:192 start_codon:yes stop_codon:yes gene_type:complete
VVEVEEVTIQETHLMVHLEAQVVEVTEEHLQEEQEQMEQQTEVEAVAVDHVHNQMVVAQVVQE